MNAHKFVDNWLVDIKNKSENYHKFYWKNKQ